MDLAPEYIREQEDVIRGNTSYARARGQRERHNAVASFVRGCSKILSVGSAGYDPILTGATHALDVSPVAGELLAKHGWKGEFTVGDCRSLPWPDSHFDAGLCMEVVEHLPEWCDVEKTFSEINRVCKTWIITFPIEGMHIKVHRRKITDEQVDEFCRLYGAKSRKFCLSRYVWKGPREPEFKEVPIDVRIPRCVHRFIIR